MLNHIISWKQTKVTSHKIKFYKGIHHASKQSVTIYPATIKILKHITMLNSKMVPTPPIDKKFKVGLEIILNKMVLLNRKFSF